MQEFVHKAVTKALGDMDEPEAIFQGRKGIWRTLDNGNHVFIPNDADSEEVDEIIRQYGMPGASHPFGDKQGFIQDEDSPIEEVGLDVVRSQVNSRAASGVDDNIVFLKRRLPESKIKKEFGVDMDWDVVAPFYADGIREDGLAAGDFRIWVEQKSEECGNPAFQAFMWDALMSLEGMATAAHEKKKAQDWIDAHDEGDEHYEFYKKDAEGRGYMSFDERFNEYADDRIEAHRKVGEEHFFEAYKKFLR